MKCTEVINITSNMGVSKVDDKVLLYLIFGQMKKDGYKYNLKDNKITREKSSCKENKVYKNILYIKNS